MIISNEHVCVFFSYLFEEKKLFFTVKQKKKIFSEQLSLLPPKPTEHYVHNVRQPSNVTYRRVTPSILSRQTLYSPLSIKTPVTLGNFSRLSRNSQIFIT